MKLTAKYIEGKNWAVVWSWPRGKMAWFIFGYRSLIWHYTRFWRVGPITFYWTGDQRKDRPARDWNDAHYGDLV